MIGKLEEHPFSGRKLAEPIELKLPDIDLEGKAVSIFTIGSVQSFIATAKKTKDMWAGSYLLSYLIWQAIEVVIKREGKDSIIFPLVEEQAFYKRFIEGNDDVDALEMPTIPNRFLALVSREKAREIMEEAREKVKKTLFDIAEKTVYKKDLSAKDREVVHRQLENMLNIYWVVLPVMDSYQEENKRYLEFKGINSSEVNTEEHPGNRYNLVTKFAEELLGSRKNLRDFNYLSEEGEKCFICGEYRAAVKVKHEDNKLCGVCALKRLFADYFKEEISSGYEPYYQSVVEIASWDYKEELADHFSDNDQIQELLGLLEEHIDDEEYITKLPRPWQEKYPPASRELLKYSGVCFDLESPVVAKHRGITRNLKEINKELGIKLNKYYALIYMDSDDIGEWVSGNKFAKELTPELHTLISKALTDYSLKSVKEIVEGKGRRGRIIYAGGDDLVAFVNLSDFFAIIRDLRAYFSGHVREGNADFLAEEEIIEVKGEKIFTLGSKASMSLGACIAHYKEPLSLVIKKAREMEERAKSIKTDRESKNALALGLIKHSGEIREGVAKWVYDDIDIIQDAIIPIIKLIREDKLSRSFLFNLREQVSVLGNPNSIPLVVTEVKRLINKQYDQEDNPELEEAIINFLKVLEKKYWAEDNKSPDLVNNFLSLLEIIFFIGKRGE